MNGAELHRIRVSARISGSAVCMVSKISRPRLSGIERGTIAPRTGELERIDAALRLLISAKGKLAETAAACGWPTPL